MFNKAREFKLNLNDSTHKTLHFVDYICYLSHILFKYFLLTNKRWILLNSDKSLDIPFNRLPTINTNWERDFIRFKNVRVAAKIVMYIRDVRIVNLKIQENRNYCVIFFWRIQPISLFLLSNFTFLSVRFVTAKTLFVTVNAV